MALEAQAMIQETGPDLQGNSGERLCGRLLLPACSAYFRLKLKNMLFSGVNSQPKSFCCLRNSIKSLPYSERIMMANPLPTYHACLWYQAGIKGCISDCVRATRNSSKGMLPLSEEGLVTLWNAPGQSAPRSIFHYRTIRNKLLGGVGSLSKPPKAVEGGGCTCWGRPLGTDPSRIALDREWYKGVRRKNTYL